MDAPAPAQGNYWRQQIENALLAPIRAMRLAYLPLLMVYFAYGATGLTAVAQTFWVKRDLTYTPAELASLERMVRAAVDHQDGVRRTGRHRADARLAAALLRVRRRRPDRRQLRACWPAAAGSWFPWMRADTLFVLASLLSVIGVVLQDVVADAMSTEVVPRINADGSPRAKAEIDHDLGMVQVLGRLALGFGIFSVAGLSGWLAQIVSYQTVFLCGTGRAAGVDLGRAAGRRSSPASSGRPTGASWAAASPTVPSWCCSASSDLPLNQEIVFVVSMGVVMWMLRRGGRRDRGGDAHAHDLCGHHHLRLPLHAERGRGLPLVHHRRAGLRRGFYGVLQQLGATIAIVAAWLFSDVVTRKPVAQVLLWLTILGFVLSLPTLGLVMRLDTITERLFGFGARSIAIFDAAASSPLDQLSMIPLAHPGRHLRAIGPSRHVVRADGLADEPGAGGRRAAEQIFEPDLPGRSRRIRQFAGAGGRDRMLISLVLPLCAIVTVRAPRPMSA